MTLKTNILTSLLNLTKIGLTTEEAIAIDVNLPVYVVNNFLRNLREIGLIEFENECIELSSNQRVKLAIYAINNGTDTERVCKVLEWKEFENFAVTAFEANNFDVKHSFRFKASGRRWEIDVLAISEPIVVCVDCKCWRSGWGNSAITKVAALQGKRTEVLADGLHYLQRGVGLGGWEKAILFPVILSLFPGPVKFYNKVPVVPILQLQNFLNEFQGHMNDLAHFRVKLGTKLSDYIDRSQ
jgi:hypothetical protein